MSLAEKIRKARESAVEAGGKKFTIRRPTAAELGEIYSSANRSPLDWVRRFVVGWDAMEIDIIPGGNPVTLPFTPELWREYIDDQPDLWEPLYTAILESVKAHAEKVEAASKK